MKRMFGPNKKMSVRWKEDKNGLAYTVVKTIGPVNYAISNSLGVTNIYHRNMLKLAFNKIETRFQALGRPDWLSVSLIKSGLPRA